MFWSPLLNRWLRPKVLAVLLGKLILAAATTLATPTVMPAAPTHCVIAQR